MGDGIVIEKKEISTSMDLYGCELEDLHIDKNYEIHKHKDQIIRGKILSEKLYDKAAAIGRRIVRINNAVNWNQQMLDNLEKGK